MKYNTETKVLEGTPTELKEFLSEKDTTKKTPAVKSTLTKSVINTGTREHKKWSDKELTTLKASYGALKPSVIASMLGRSLTAVSQRASILGIATKRPRKL